MEYLHGDNHDDLSADNIIIGSEIIKTMNSPIYVEFIDFKKAFDKLWRYELLTKSMKSVCKNNTSK